MKKILFILFAFGLMNISSYAQVSYYTFGSATNTFDTLASTVKSLTPLTTATTGNYYVDSTVAAGSPTVNKGIGLPIGFNFTFNGTVFNVFGVQQNGWISFGKDSVDMQSSNVSSPISATSTASAALQNRVSAFGHALVGKTNSYLSYATIGTAPNRILVVEWKNYKRSTNTSAANDNMNFQIRLHETTNVVECVYGTFTYSSTTASTSQIGLRGQANTDYNNRSTSTDWTATIAGTASNSTVSVSSAIYPPVGLTYTWTPPAVVKYDAGITAINAPTGIYTTGTKPVTVTIKNFGSANLTKATINWSVNGTLQTAYNFTNAGLAQYATNGPITLSSYAFNTAGAYTIKAWTSLPNDSIDGNKINDTLSSTVYALSYASLPFNESFDSTWVNFMNTHDVPSFHWVNTPATGNSSWRRDDDGTSGGWTTTTGAYTPVGVGSQVAPHSARFHSAGAGNTTSTLDAYVDFSQAGGKAIKFWHINTSGTDSLFVYLSSDAGQTFSLMQKFATAATWTQHFISLGTSTTNNAIVRFYAKNQGGGGTGTDIGIDSVQIYVVPANDAGLTAINAPSTPILPGSTPVSVTVKNYGGSPLTSASIGWSVNGVAQTSYSYTNAGLASGSTDGPVTIGNFNFPSSGFYTIKAWTSLPNGSSDADYTNDTVSKTIYVMGFASLPFNESFNGTWVNMKSTRDVPSLYWVNSPATGNASWRRNDDATAAAWTGTNTGAYTPTGVGNAPLYSARFHSGAATAGSIGTLDAYVNFNTAGTKALKFWHINTTGTDTLSVFMSNDGGTTFNLVQKFATAAAWTQHYINLGTSTAANSIVRFSVTNLTTGTGSTDVGIDSVQIYLLPSNEMAAVSWVAPISSCSLTNAETVTIKVTNKGAVAQSSIPVKYSIDGGSTYKSGTIAGPVNPGDTVSYTFTTTANFSSKGTYNCIAVVALANDQDLTNDTLKTVVNSVNGISGNPFIDSLDAGNKHYILTYSTNSLVSLDSLVGVNSTYAFNMTGGAAGTLWPSGTSATTTPQQAFSYTDHVSSIKTCTVDASAFTTKLFLHLDLRQTCSQTTGNLYSYFMVLVNGTDTISDVNGTKFFNPITTNSDAFASKSFDLTTYKGTSFALTFMAACKYNDATLGGTADHVYLDNIALYVPPTINNLGPDTTICKNDPITLNAGPGTGYSYSWEMIPGNNVVGTSQTYSADSTGTYVAIVTNQLGFTASDTINITVNPIPVANAGIDTTVNYQTTATLHGSATPSTGTYAYSWAPANLLVNANVQNPTTKPLTVTTVFTLTVKDSVTGCVGTDQVIVNNIGGPLSVTTHAKPDTICAGESVLLTALASGGTSTNYTYTWNTTPVLTNDSINVSPTANTTYIVTVTSGANTATSSIAVVVHPTPVVNLGKDTTVCKGKTITLHAGTGSGYTYNWSNGTTSSTLAVDQSFANSSDIATIIVTVTNTYGCSKSDTIVITFITCTGIDEYGNGASIAAYPNPSNGMINIAVNGLNSNAELTVFTLQGKAILSMIVKNNSITSLNLTYLPKGAYIIRVNNEKTNIISKLIIQ